jgi:UDP-hydrolysing UDP-N-acetyl-D-glucosamine 2-epimerase
MRTIGVVTVARSDYGIYRPVLCALAARDDVRLQLYVGGMHLLERFGSTVEEIERDGFPIAERVDFLLPDDTPQAVAESVGRGVIAFAEAFTRSRPDVLVVLGDRFEMFAAGIAALPLGLPLAHIHGGELTAGAIDDAMRHALTKLSHLHFVSTEQYAARVRQLGEEEWRVVVSGAPALDALVDFRPLDAEELQAEFGVSFEQPTLLVTFHPETLEPERTVEHAGEVIAAVRDSGLDAVYTYPNADAGHRRLVELCEEASSSSDRYRIVRNFGTRAYFSVLGRAAAMVGNSSSGLLEAPSFHLPVVNVGSRQRGRVRAANVIDVEAERAAIAAAIQRATSTEFRQSLDGLTNPYGDGHAAARIVEVLATTPLDERLLTKRFRDADA